MKQYLALHIKKDSGIEFYCEFLAFNDEQAILVSKQLADYFNALDKEIIRIN